MGGIGQWRPSIRLPLQTNAGTLTPRRQPITPQAPEILQARPGCHCPMSPRTRPDRLEPSRACPSSFHHHHRQSTPPPPSWSVLHRLHLHLHHHHPSAVGSPIIPSSSAACLPLCCIFLCIRCLLSFFTTWSALRLNFIPCLPQPNASERTLGRFRHRTHPPVFPLRSSRIAGPVTPIQSSSPLLRKGFKDACRPIATESIFTIHRSFDDSGQRAGL